MFSVAYGMRTTVKKVLLMVTDGNEDVPDRTMESLDKIRDLGKSKCF